MKPIEERATFILLSVILIISIFSSQPKSIQVENKNTTESVTESPTVIDAYIEQDESREYSKTYYVTHYCSCIECTGYEHTDYVFGAEGVELTPMVSVASNEFPFETQLLVTHEDGSQEVWVVQDRGGFDYGQLDLYTGTNHEVALSIPNEYVTVEVFEPGHFDMWVG